MKRARHFGQWVGSVIAGLAIFTACIALAFWDTVILGRTFDDQTEGGR